MKVESVVEEERVDPETGNGIGGMAPGEPVVEEEGVDRETGNGSGGGGGGMAQAPTRITFLANRRNAVPHVYLRL